jgi:hypothetical protein
MRCERHGEVRFPIDGRCRECLRDEVIERLSTLVGELSIEISADDPLLAFVPRLELWPRDISWLHDGSLNAEATRRGRSLFARAYLDSAVRTLESGSGTQALLLLGSATAFEPEDHRIQWRIHFHTAAALRRVLESRGEYGVREARPVAAKVLASIVCHLEIALQHLDRAGGAGEDPAERARAEEAEAFLREVLSFEHFEIREGWLRGAENVGSGAFETFLFPSVPKGPGLD